MADTGSKPAVDHCLALKVMRLTRPTLGQTVIVQSEPGCRDLEGDTLQTGLAGDINTAVRLPALQPGGCLVLPQSFGNIYLGETFTSYVCVHNDSTEECGPVAVRADLQTASQRVNLVPGPAAQAGDSTNHSRESLPPGSTIDQVVQHEVKELGTHILVCEVNYNSQAGERLNFRKFFKFQVMKPLDVKTKFYNAESDEVFLEAQVQNITQTAITMERVTLEPSNSFTVESITAEPGPGQGVAARGLALQVQDSWQYLFCLKPRPEHNNKNLRQVTNIGKLDIVWRTGLCERGRLQTSQLQRLAPGAGEVRLVVVQAPSYALLGRPTPLTLRLENTSERTVELELSLEAGQGTGLSWAGRTRAGLGLVEPGGSTQLGVECVLHQAGLVSLQGIHCTDTLLNRDYCYDDQVQVYGLTDEELYTALTTTQ